MISIKKVTLRLPISIWTNRVACNATLCQTPQLFGIMSKGENNKTNMKFIRGLMQRLLNCGYLCPAAGQIRQYVATIDTSNKPNGQLNIFDRKTKLMQRERCIHFEDPNVYDYLRDEVGFVLADRILDIHKDLKLILDMGCGKGHILRHLNSSKVRTVIATDTSRLWLDHAVIPEDITCEKIVMDEENITFEPNIFDLVVSGLNLHWVNDLPNTFRRINQILKPDGVFIGAMFGCETLYELRCSLQLSELEREGGIGSHVSPFAQIRDIGGLLTIGGFNMLTIDTQDIKINYPSIFELMEDLKGMGENNASWSRKPFLKRDTMFAAGAIYKEMYENSDGSIPATFQIIYMIAWKPDPSQPKPLPRQKPDVSLKDLHKIK